MTQKIYKTAQGKTVDLGALMLQNENTRAVGNMKVNARGDIVDGWNRPIHSRTHQIQKQYERQVTNVKDQPVVASVPMPVANAKPVEITQPTKAVKTMVETEPMKSTSDDKGLAGAIARARQIKQEPVARAGRGNDNQGPKRI
jgi:hypothetical protein